MAKTITDMLKERLEQPFKTKEETARDHITKAVIRCQVSGYSKEEIEQALQDVLERYDGYEKVEGDR